MATKTDGRKPSDKELQRKIGQTRDSLRTTVEAIQDKAEQQYEAVKQTASDVLDYRDEFQKEPVVWSLGALSAGFALGHTLGYAHKIARRDRNSPLAGIVDELSTVGQRIVMPTLNENITKLFGFDFPALLNEMRGGGSSKRPTRKRTGQNPSAKKSSRRKKSR